jgi:hypothetical protein
MDQQQLLSILAKNKEIYVKVNNRLVKISISDEPIEPSNDITIVTALWDLGRSELSGGFERSYEHYKEQFAQLLKTSCNMFIYVSKEDEEFIWKHRDRSNTYVKTMELSEFDTGFEFFNKVQEIRETPEWFNQTAWLTESPQAKLKYYNPLVMSKMFMLNNATIFNPFESDQFYWIDAAITNTVHPGYFSHDRVFDNLEEISKQINGALFISYPYEGGEEIHGFSRTEMAKYCSTDYVRYVCRGGFFGGTKEQINQLNAIYHGILSDSLSKNLMGTEESIFTIMAHKYPELITRFGIGSDGLLWPFFEKMKSSDEFIKELSKIVTYTTAKNILYVLGFNSPSQFESIVKSIETTDVDMFINSRRILINNSTDEELFSEYDRLCELYAFEEIHRENLGVCGGRQFAAEHFQESAADFYMFFEDDMHLTQFDATQVTCRNGFVRHVSNLYKTVVKIMLKEKLDFLKFSFSELYGDNSTQWAWYNVPQKIRTEFWPNYDKLPETGLDYNAPKTQFDTIEIMDQVPYIKGEIYYSNWPQIVSREGNKKMFLDTKWERPYEQTWMSHMFQLTKNNQLHGAVLLASPIVHDRFDYYDGSLRKES